MGIFSKLANALKKTKQTLSGAIGALFSRDRFGSEFYDELEEVLAQKKNADFKNKEVVISAKSDKQTCIINAEGERDRKIREAEGEAQRLVTAARGQAQAMLNDAQAEARSIQEISRSLEGSGDDPSKYLIAMKYISMLKEVCALPQTKVVLVPQETLMAQTAQLLGLNTIIPRH